MTLFVVLSSSLTYNTSEGFLWKRTTPCRFAVNGATRRTGNPPEE
ncbi:hypothetical protein BIFANG_03468 [Bifidobacterium angulatum DSM 20098 = JCM 7096]|uniref:Uncharacterized protein n=1 Tax=Bifidobacterium angulatum DSM 20098 = JCM 7096 TaxID=518635 RepID=C4FGJ5_9BIFI|nr:hypothetical protein BIFANG_03468 [Bifidobacterium angulatum DSM 20098 = JCM 7096]